MKIFCKILFLSLLIPASVFAYVSPGAPQGFVNDFAGIISASDRSQIETNLKNLRASKGIEVAVATVPSLGGDTIENYAVKLFQEWGIGNKQKDNGLLILVAPNEREVRIEVGYGLEGTITDLQSGNIINKVMIPAFKKGDYSGGIKGATDAVISIVTNSSDASIYSEPPATPKNANNYFGLIFIGIIGLNILARFLGKTKSWWLGGVLGGVIGAILGLIFGFVYIGIVSIIVLAILGLIFDFLVSKFPPGSGKGPGDFWGSFGGGSGFGGGGFGGFGGGSSGGGGASGRW